MKLYFSLFLLLITYSNGEKIKILTDANAGRMNWDNNTLVLFTISSQCPLCEEMDKAFKQAFRQHKSKPLPLKFGKIDVVKSSDLALRYGGTGFPQIRLIQKNSSVTIYDGTTNSTDLINWLKKKLLHPVEYFTSPQALSAFIKKQESCLIYFGSTTNKFFRLFMTVSQVFHNIGFLHCSSKDCLKEFNIKDDNHLLLTKFYGETLITLPATDSTLEEFKHHLSLHYSSDLFRFDVSVSTEIFTEGVPAMILYRREKDDKEQKFGLMMKRLAQELRGKMRVVVSDLENEIEKSFGDMLGIKRSDLPCVRIIESGEILKKYEFTGQITFENLYKFFVDWKVNKLSTYSKSGPVTHFEEGKLFHLVAKNHWQKVFEKDKDVLVLYYKGNDEGADKNIKIFEELAIAVQKSNALYVSCMNLNENEIELFDRPPTPFVRLFPAGTKDGHIDYKASSINLGELVLFLKKYAQNRVFFEKSDL